MKNLNWWAWLGMFVLAGCGGGSGASYGVGGSVSGLVAGQTLVLQDNGGDALTVSANGAFSFPQKIASGGSYAITVATQPAGETCSVAGGSGSVASADVANAVVSCSDKSFVLGGSVSGLVASGLVLANGAETLAVPSGAGQFSFATPVAFTSGYAVTVSQQPAGLSCAVQNASGSMPAQDVKSVAVSCTDQPFTLGGTIAGLGAATGLVLANGADTLAVPASATQFTMPAQVPFSTAYAVTVQAAPVGLSCSVANGSGTMPASNVGNVAVTCATQSFNVGGSVSGLTATGLVLVNGSSTLAVASGAVSFKLPVAVPFGSSYAVQVQAQPAGQTCSVSQGSGTMGAADVTNVQVACSASAYTLGGSISGLTAYGLALANGSDVLTVQPNATAFTMPTAVASGAAYNVTVKAQPPVLNCSVSGGSGTIAGANVGSVVVSCTPLPATPTSSVYTTAYNDDGTPATPVSGTSSWTKIDANGNPLPASATSWACILDSTFKLMWQAADSDTQLFVIPAGGYNGFPAGYYGGSTGGIYNNASIGVVDSYPFTDSGGYQVAANLNTLCGYSNWRVPKLSELSLLIQNPQSAPSSQFGMMNWQWFIHPSGDGNKLYWTSVVHPANSGQTWVVDFTDGSIFYPYTNYGKVYLRLVRSVP